MSELNYDYKPLPPFKWFILQNFPFIEADFDALTNWELFCKLGNEMNKIINDVNASGKQVENLTLAYNALKDYVDNYFENLDVTDEINAKLDDMIPEITELLLNYTSIPKVFDTIADMVDDTTLVVGAKCKTLGGLTLNDGNGADYYITDTQSTSDVQIQLDNDLYATLVNTNDFITLDQSNFEEVLCNTDQKDFKNYFIKGEINLDHAVTIKNLRWSTIRGDGFYRSSIKIACSSGGILFEDCTYNIFEDVTFLSNTTNTDNNWVAGDGDYIIKLKNARTFTFNNCYFRFANKDAIVITHSWLTTFNGCYFNDNYRYAINIDYSDSVQPNTIINNCFINNSHQAGILIQTPQVYIKNSVLQASEHGHIIIDSSSLDLYNIEITRNDMEISGDKPDIIFKGSNNIEYVSITQNTLANNAQGNLTKIIDLDNFTGNMYFLEYKQNKNYFKNGFVDSASLSKLNYTDDIDWIAHQSAYDQILPTRGCGKTTAISIPIQFNQLLHSENIVLPYTSLNGTLTITCDKTITSVSFRNAFGITNFTTEDNLVFTGEVKGNGLLIVNKTGNFDAQVSSSILNGFYQR